MRSPDPQSVAERGHGGDGVCVVRMRTNASGHHRVVPVDAGYHVHRHPRGEHQRGAGAPFLHRRDAATMVVEAFSGGPGWVTEWQYGQVRDLLAARADLVVWLDLPRVVVMRQIMVRTVRRRMHRERLWHGNVEPPLWMILADEDHIIRWAWTTPQDRPPGAASAGRTPRAAGRAAGQPRRGIGLAPRAAPEAAILERPRVTRRPSAVPTHRPYAGVFSWLVG